MGEIAQNIRSQFGIVSGSCGSDKAGSWHTKPRFGPGVVKIIADGIRRTKKQTFEPQKQHKKLI